jgi:CheY-like chemotaxis protein/predicted regulator of Ras-like GTPase activity (Roadblock/LC7/MglB family)
MAPSILVVDRNEAFATMLEQMLVAEGGYEVQVAHGVTDAMVLLRQANFDLTILDMDLGLEKTGYHDLIRSVRAIRPTMRLMVIPLIGQDLPPLASQLDIQGTLSKPFFADDLLPAIEGALAKQVSSPRLQVEVQPRPARPDARVAGAKAMPQIQALLSELARETVADAVLLVSTGGDSARVVAHVGQLDASQAGRLADLIRAALRSAQAVVHFLGHPDLPFEHNMFEAGDWRLYVLVLQPALLLAVVTPLSTHLGTIRHNLRRAGRDLTGLALT